MEGPTPVSALIHAATMVTAGVYLDGPHRPRARRVAACPDGGRPSAASPRSWPPPSPSPSTTSRRCSPTRPSASSASCSSPSGPGAYVAAVFHLITHAFFKALLFLGSGSVIHAMSDEQDMRRMGGLRKMPVTAATIVGWLAIAGMPPFAGFWSKDEILVADSPGAGVLLHRAGHGPAHRVLHDAR